MLGTVVCDAVPGIGEKGVYQMEGNLNALTTIFTEFYYFVTIVYDVSDPRWLLHV